MGRAPARLLPLQHLQLLRKAEVEQDSQNATPTQDDDPNHGLGPLARNRMRLYSYYKPSLEAGTYGIYAEQHIELSDTEGKKNLMDDKALPQKLRVWNRKVDPSTTPPPSPGAQPPKPEPQIFEVMAPQFSLNPKLINSYYPPDGHQDEAKILPHICFSDPHLPWERDAGKHVFGLLDAEPGTDPPVYRSMTPWLALLVFDPSELKLDSATEAQALGIPGFADPTKVDMNSAENARGTFGMSVADYLKLNSRIYYDAGYKDNTGKVTDETGWDEIQSSTEQMMTIFPKKDLFMSLFKNENYKPPSSPPDPSVPVQRTDNIESFKYLAHVRHINATGCPDAGIDQEGLFSVVVSARTGNISITQPTPQICHLVSLEHIDSTYELMHNKTINNDDSIKRIGMVSLFSWIYMGLPPDPVNFVTTIRDLLLQRQVLRSSQSILNTMKPSQSSSSDQISGNVASQLHSRLSFGYTISRWRTETGEEAAAFNRGPLVPQPVERPSGFPGFSHTSKEFQIVDLATGLVDLSYSSAWHLGKLLAISDGVFNSALMRFRSQVHNYAADQVRKEESNMKSAAQTIRATAKAMPHAVKLSAGRAGAPMRLTARPEGAIPPRLDTPELRTKFKEAVIKTVRHLSLAGDTIYSGLNLDKPNSTDWTTIHNWVFEKMYLSDIPAHYLIPDPSFLPLESIRFFHIDDTWIDCLLDGALSVANHLDRDDDWIRAAIKATLNVYLKTPDSGIVPQIPCCGFILRSQVVKVMPDLRITVQWSVPDSADHKRHEVCRYTKLDDQTIMGLFDRPFEELDNITLAQPPHQQNFSLGTKLEMNPPTLEVLLKHLFTDQAPDGAWDPPQKDPPGETRLADWIAHQPKADVTKDWYDFTPGGRMINIAKMAEWIHIFLNTWQPPKPGVYQDPVGTSCEMALQLNNPSYYFFIQPEVQTKANTVNVREIAGGEKVIGDIPTPDTPGSPAGPPAKAVDPSSGITNSQGGLPENTIPTAPITARSPVKPIRMTTINLPTVMASPSNELGALQLHTNFTLSIYPDFKGSPVPFADNAYDANDFCPTQHPYLYDLIFSVRKDPHARGSTYSLKEILIDIPHEGGYLTNPREEALLREDYDGPGARMFSNQRFVIFLNKTAKVLTVRLVPRSALDNLVLPLTDSRTDQVSFRLAEPYIAEIKNKFGVMVRTNGVVKKLPRSQVSIWMYERYQTPLGDKLVSSQCFVIKKNNLERDPTE